MSNLVQNSDNKVLSLSEGNPALVKRQGLCQTRVTLNGKPAVVTGAKMKFATVMSLDGILSFEWAWEAVESVIVSGGKFLA